MLLIALAALYGHGGTAVLENEEEARAVADTLPGGFDAATCVLDANSEGALLRDEAGRIALVAPHGAHFVPHLFNTGDRARLIGERLEVTIGSRRYALRLGAVAEEWHKRISAQIEPDG